MRCKLSDEQRAWLNQSPHQPLELVDEQSQARYVLLSSEQYDRLQAAGLHDLHELRATYGAQSESLSKAGWDAPDFDLYNDYDANRP
jgi:hypothetical protein